MPTSLARRIRRIGLLPSLSLVAVMDPEQQTKLKNAHDRVDTAKNKVTSAQSAIEDLRTKKASKTEHNAAIRILDDANSELAATQKNLDDLLLYLQEKVGHLTRQRLPLTEAEIAEQAQSLIYKARTARIEAFPKSSEQDANRIARLKKAFASKAA